MSLNICRITFCSNSGEEREITGQFEYMSYYLLLKLMVCSMVNGQV